MNFAIRHIAGTKITSSRGGGGGGGGGQSPKSLGVHSQTLPGPLVVGIVDPQSSVSLKASHNLSIARFWQVVIYMVDPTQY